MRKKKQPIEMPLSQSAAIKRDLSDKSVHGGTLI